MMFSDIAKLYMVSLIINSTSLSKLNNRMLKTFNNIKIEKNVKFHICWGISERNTDFKNKQLTTYANSFPNIANIDIHTDCCRSTKCSFYTIKNRGIKDDSFYCKDCKKFLIAFTTSMTKESSFSIKANNSTLSNLQLIEKVKYASKANTNLDQKVNYYKKS